MKRLLALAGLVILYPLRVLADAWAIPEDSGQYEWGDRWPR